MNRKTKNIIMGAVIVCLIATSSLTFYQAKKSASSPPGHMNMQKRPDSKGSQAPPEMNGNTDGNNKTAPPDKNGGSNEKSDSSSNSSQDSSKSEKNSSGSGSTDQNKVNPPSQDSDSSSKSSSGPPEMPNGQTPPDMKGNGLSGLFYALFGVQSFMIVLLAGYLVMSKGNKQSFAETFRSSKMIAVFSLAAIMLTAGLTASEAMLAKKASGNSAMSAQTQSAETTVEAKGATEVDGKEETLNGSYSSKTADENAVLVKNGGSAKITGAKITKSGDTTSTEQSEFNGINAGVLTTKSSTTNISDTSIKTSATGANAVFATGENAKVYVKNTTIETTGKSSARGLDATYGGYIEADNVTITTKGGSCATLATDRGEGTVKAENSTLTTNGSGSPIIYSTGDISITNSKGTSNGSQIAVIEGKNSATVTSSEVICSAKGNRNDVDNCGVMIYQSMSGDASEGVGTFTAKNSTLSVDKKSDYYKSAPMFFSTNTDAVINLTNTKLEFGSGVLLSAKGTDEWGENGKNGADVTLNASNQTLSGKITADKISAVTINLKDSTFTGSINTDKTAKKAVLTLDKNSKIKLTGDTYLTKLTDEDKDYSNIDFNGYRLYVNGKAVN